MVNKMDLHESFEMQTAGWNEEVFTRFCNALIAAMASRHYGPNYKTCFTERTKAQDEGLDAVLEVYDERDVSGGVVGPGVSGYQYKFRDPTSKQSAADLPARICQELKSQISKIRLRYPNLRRYAILTNVNLGPQARRRIETEFASTWDPNPPAVVVLSGADIGAYRVDYSAMFRSFGHSATLETNSERVRWRQIRENWEFVRGFWDGPPTAEEAIAILECPADDPDRRWLVRRVLENDKRSVARRLLGDEEIKQAVEKDAELDPKVADAWSTLLLTKVPAWKS